MIVGIIYLVLAYWATGQTIYRNKILFGTAQNIFLQRLMVGACLGIFLIPIAIIQFIIQCFSNKS